MGKRYQLSPYERKRKQETQLEWLASIVSRMQQEARWGSVTFHMERGLIVRVVRSDSMVPPDDEAPQSR